MSWKASAYVKEIVRGVTPSEKLVLFVLADYHNTAHKAAWPSLVEMAEQALVTKVGLCRILTRLEEAGFIERTSGGGKGKRTEYRLPGLDGKQSPTVTVNSSVTVTETPSNSNPNSNPRGGANKEVEPVLEPQTSILSSPPVPTEDLVLNSNEGSSTRPKKKQAPPSDLRHMPFREKLEKFWVYLNPDVDSFAWGPGEAGQLSEFLRKWPKLTLKDFHFWLVNYSDSDDTTPSKTPKQFLPFLHEYANGPRNEFHRPKDAHAQA